MSVSECVCLSVAVLAATYLAYMTLAKVRQCIVSCRLLEICIAWTSLKMFRLGDMALFA